MLEIYKVAPSSGFIYNDKLQKQLTANIIYSAEILK